MLTQSTSWLAMKTEDLEKIIARAQKSMEQGNYQEAQTRLEAILKEDWEDEPLRAKAFLFLGMTSMRRGDFNAALMHLKTAQRKAIDPSWVLLEAVRVEGIICSERGDYKGALERYQVALEYGRAIHNQKAIVACLNNIALIHMHRGEFETALDIFDEGLNIAVEAEDKEESSKILNNMAEIFSKRGQYDLAYEHYRRSLQLDIERGDKAGQAIVLNNISEIYKARGDYTKSIEYLEEAYNISKEIGLVRNLGYVLSNLGELHWLEGDLRKAVEVLEQGIQLCNEVGLEDETYWRMLLLLAGVQNSRDNYDEAERLLETAESLNERLQSESLAAEIYAYRGTLEAPETGKGNLGNAKMAYNKALELAERLKLTEVWMNASLGLAYTFLGEYSSSLEEERLLKAEQRLDMIFEKAKEEMQVPILTRVVILQGLLRLAQLRHDEALEKFEEAQKIANSRGLTYLATKATEQYERAVQMREKSRKILAKDANGVQDVIQYVKDRVREVQKMVQTYGGG
ncbi:MAG: tetratricopeptide repeat protein [Candidatus Hodarchaeales archaeon]